MNAEELEKFYAEFLNIISDDLIEEIRREGRGWTVEKAVENRLDILREDVKVVVKNKL